MKLLLLAGFLSLAMVGASVARADDCAGKLTVEQGKTYTGLTPADQQAMANMKMKNKSPATCEFRAGLLDMLGNFPPEDRAASFHQLLKDTFVKQD